MDYQEVRQSPTSGEPQVFYGYIVVVAAFIIMVTICGVFSTFGVFMKPILNEFGWTRATTSGAFSLSWIVQGLLGIVMGSINDRLGPRIVIAVCGSIFGLGYLLMSQISTLWQLYLFYAILIATGMSSTVIPLMSTVARWFVKRRGVMTGVVVAGVGIGGLIAPPVANWLISIYDWQISYIILGSITLVVVVLIAQLLKRDPTEAGQIPYGENKEETELKGSIKAFSLEDAASTRQFWLISSMYFCLGFCVFIIMVHIAPHATDLGFSAASAANILATVGGAGVIGRVVFGFIADRIGIRQILIIGFILMAATLFWLVPVTEIWALYLLTAIFGFTSGGCAMLQSPLVAELFGLRSHGLLLGFTSLGYCIGAAVGPFLAGYIFDIDNSYKVAFLVCVATSVIGLVLTTLLSPTKTS